MRTTSFWIAASCILAAAALLPVLSSGASPASKEKVLYSFKGAPDGAGPMSDLTLDSAGNLYGTTASGRTGTACNGGGCGTVFELQRTKDGWTEQVLYSFAGGNDGAGPEAGLIFDNAGNLYGTTAYGGNVYGSGTVFELTPNSRGEWTERIIYSFNYYGGAGGNPTADLAFDAQGNLYGTTSAGGNGTCLGNGCGGVFRLIPRADGSWIETTLHAFTDVPDGGVPSAGVVLDSAGSVYGLTTYGGTGTCRPENTYGEVVGCGILYKLTPYPGTSWTETILYSFVRGGGFGMYPSGMLFFEDVNHLLGVTQAGGDGLGTVFELQNTVKSGWRQNVLHIFYGDPDGVRPVGRLVKDANGNLFGVTSWGGTANGNGIVFELEHSKSGWKERIVHKFSGPQYEANPLAELVSDSQGNLYGTTQYGGNGTGCNLGCGKVYEVTP